MQTAAAYIRVSTDDQIEYSPDSQIKAIRKYAKDHDMILPEEFIFVDEGISGRKADKRPSFQRMIGTAKIKPKPFDVILLWKFSRFARNRQDSIVYKSMLRKQCGIDVVSISEQLGDDNTSILIEALIEAMDEYYSLNLAEEVKRGMTEKFSRGGVVSQPPYGYMMKNGIFAPDPETAPIVQKIFADFIAGKGTREIARELNDLGLRTAKGNFFENRAIEYIITNPVYIGKLRRSKEKNISDHYHQDAENTLIVNGNHVPIIDTETFEQAQRKRSELKQRYPKHARQTPSEFMLKGIVRCSACGATLVNQSAAKSLQCHNYARGVCKTSHSITVKKINAAVLEKLRSDAKSQNFEVAVEPTGSSSSSAPDFSSLIAREKKKLARVREAYEAGVDTLAEYKTAKQKIQDHIAELEAKAAKVLPKSDKDIKEIISRKIMASLEILESDETSEALKNYTLRGLVDRITYIKPKGIIEILYKM